MNRRPGIPRLGDVAQQCLAARYSIRFLLADNLMPLKACKDSATRLDEAITNMITGPNLTANWENTLNPYFSDPIRQAVNQFQVDLSTALRMLPYMPTEAHVA